MLLRRRAILRKAPRQERASFTFESILDAAQQLLLLAEADRSFQMAGLAKRAGVSTGTLYQYFPDGITVLGALLERMWQRGTQHFRVRFSEIQAESLNAFLHAFSTAVAEAAHREHALRVAVHRELHRNGAVGQQIDISREWIAFLAEVLTPYLPGVPPERLLVASRAMIWVADGMVDGISGWEEATMEDLRDALLAAWQGIAASELKPLLR